MEIYEVIEKLHFTSITWQVLTPLIFSLADFITGYIQAVINKDVSSQKMRVGLLHKILIMLVIILSFVINFAFNTEWISKVVCIYVIIMEITSIIENLKKAGLDVGKFGEMLKGSKKGE